VAKGRVAAGFLIVVAALGCGFGFAPPAFAGQKPADIPDLIRLLRKQPLSSNQSASEPQTSILPTISSNPAIGVSFGALMSRAVRRGGPDSRLSTVHASIAFTTKSQIVAAVRNDLHSADDAWSLVGDARLAKFQQAAPRLGSGQAADTDALGLKYNWIRFYQTAYRQVRGPFQLGVGYHLDAFMDMRLADAEAELPPEIGSIPSTTVASGLSLDALFDSRDNSLNASRGFYGRASYYYNPVFLGSDSDWQSLQLEARAYVKLPSERRQVLAAWTQWWQRLDGRPPYLSLPSPGWDTYGRSGRGYAAGKLRGRDWMYGETEYRLDLMRNGLVGMVGFVNASNLSDAEGTYGGWAIGAGTGVRVKLNKRDGTNIAMDVAWGRNGKVGVWFGLNEVF
jgi:hypothetical protein